MVIRIALAVAITGLIFWPLLHLILFSKTSLSDYRTKKFNRIKAMLAADETILFVAKKKLPHYLIFAFTLYLCDVALVLSPGNTGEDLLANPMFGLFAVLIFLALLMPMLAVTEYTYKGFVLTDKRFYWYGLPTLGKITSVPKENVRGLVQTLYGQIKLELLKENGRWTRLTLDPFAGHGVFVRIIRKANPGMRHIVQTLMGKQDMNKPPKAY